MNSSPRITRILFLSKRKSVKSFFNPWNLRTTAPGCFCFSNNSCLFVSIRVHSWFAVFRLWNLWTLDDDGWF